MLLESVNYPKEIPVSIGFQAILEEPYHYHKELEIVLVLRGKTQLKVRHNQYELVESDLILIDMRDPHQFYQSSDDILMIVMHLDAVSFADLYPDIEIMVFSCEECTRESQNGNHSLSNKVSLLKHYVASIILEWLNGDTVLLKKNLKDFVHTLVKEFQGFYIEDHYFKAVQETTRQLDLDRIYHIIKYIGKNYERKITLKEVAELEHLNPYYVSHLLKRITGLNFQTFVNYVRMEYAEILLLEEHMTLIQISEFCGFSSPSFFSQFFKEWHGVTPSTYKGQFKIYERVQAEVPQELAESLLAEYINSYKRLRTPGTSCAGMQPLQIEVEYRSVKEPRTAGDIDAIDAGTVCQSVSRLLNKEFYEEELSHCFYTGERLVTPDYVAAQLLKELSEPMLHRADDFAISGAEDGFCIVIANCDPVASLEIKATIRNITGQYQGVKTVYLKEDNFSCALKKLGDPKEITQTVRDAINIACCCGRIEFFHLSAAAELEINLQAKAESAMLVRLVKLL